MSRKYFGTDGIRGRVGEPPLTPEFALKLGWAAGKVLSPKGHSKVVIGKDTRLSGYLFESALEAGFAAAGAQVLLVGPLPTPGIAYLAQTFRARAGVVISASHNPFHDNGVKFFNGHGEKLGDDIELAIEALLDEPLECVAPDKLGRARRIDDAEGRYVEFCKGTFRSESSLAGLKIVVDCAHGATYRSAPHVFQELGAKIIPFGTEPDGLNINRDCGSTHPDVLAEAVVAEGADLGIALDGDGDRCILVDDAGRIIDGDDIVYIIAQARQADATLRGPVVGTVMSNLGVELALRKLGIAFERTPVGDRHVLEKLRETNGVIGGESSGHILCLDRTTTGDGTVSALQVLAVMVETGHSLAELLDDVEKYPQKLINVPVSGTAATVMDAEAVKASVADVESTLGDTGRVLLRPSGTEPLIRVMVEGADAEQVHTLAEQIAETVRAAA